MSITLRRGLFAAPSARLALPLRGFPRLQAGVCDACLKCVDVCPTRCLAVQETGGQSGLALDWQRCLCCGLCAEACPRDAIEIGSDVLIADRTGPK